MYHKYIYTLLSLALVLTCGNGLTAKHKKTGFPKPVSDKDYYDEGNPNEAKVALGNFLFFDKIISGNQNISCATCHHPLADTGDGLSLPIGEGAIGLGVTRDTGNGADAVHERVPRNAPHIFNLGAKEFDTMFHDGRVQTDPEQPSGFRSPAGDNLPLGLDNPLAVQAMFPVTSGTEMAGQAGENSIADAASIGDLAGPDGVWELIAQRLRTNEDYQLLFMDAYPEISDASQITYVHAANAIAAFEADAWRADSSPYDQFMRGDWGALSHNEIRGMRLFYGKAKCSSCHSGNFQTDQSFHAIAMPQVGPGKGHGIDGHEDHGRSMVTGNQNDFLKFRTPTLRNVALTAPYGHDGAYNTLEEVVRHHLNPRKAIEEYDPIQLLMPSRPDLDAIDLVVHNDPSRRAEIAAASEIKKVRLNNRQIAYLLDFLNALTDPDSIDLRIDVPTEVPSGLPLYD